MSRKSEMVDLWNSEYQFVKMGGSYSEDKVLNSYPRILQLESREDRKQKMRLTLFSTFASQTIDPRVALSLDEAIQFEIRHGRKLNPDMDKRKLRRTISNRLSAQRSRMKRAQYIHDMEQMVNELERTILSLSPQIESFKEQLQSLIHQNTSLQQIVEIRSNESKIRQRELEETQMEAYRLKQVAKVLNRTSQSHGPGFGFGFHNDRDPFDEHFRVKMEISCGLEGRKYHEEAEVDQYINFEALNSDTTSPIGTRSLA